MTAMRIYEGALFALKVTGRDAVDLLHRVTSNDVRGLAVGDENRQCLLTMKGRMIAPFRLRREADGCVLKGPLELKPAVVEALERYIIIDDVTVESLEDEPGPPDDETARIERGEPRWEIDVDGDTIPYEANLEEYVSTKKGCYTGQEVMARIETYGQVQKRLVRLESRAARRPSCCVLKLEGAEAGRITSVGERVSSDGAWHALGLARRDAWAPGTELEGEDGVRWSVTN
jgi:folate-binding protein YgfZ